jgi:hypothetical protein
MPRKTRRKIQAARARFRAWIFLSSREQVTYTSEVIKPIY